MKMGPRMVVAKQGEYGAALYTDRSVFALPAYPLETVVDPTGAGDSFAGGFLGYLDAQSGDLDDQTLRHAMTINPHLKVFVANGYYDLATPYFAAEYDLKHMALQPQLQANISYEYYPAGHMLYHDAASRQKLHDDIARFIQSATAQ